MFRTSDSEMTLKQLHAEENHSALVALLVARAGAKDSLNWWDDDSLTSAGEFVLGRIFPRKWKLISYRLAMYAAKEKHDGAARTVGLEDFTTLFSNVFIVGLESAVAEGIVSSPINSMDEFKGRLTTLCPRVTEFDVPQPQASGLLDITDITGDNIPSTETLVEAFASGYTRAQAGKPVFPFIRRFGGVR